ncbi:hypothetical protein JCM10207_003562 [Rhodosporidiobolus poonsookiae]
MAEGARPAFRPTRGRASLSALPSSTLPTLSLASKENDSTTPLSHPDTAPDTTGNKRKKRAQSLGGDALEGARKRLKDVEALKRDAAAPLELSPGKLERRRAAPRRSILKQTPALFGQDNHTISFPPSRASLGGVAFNGSHTTDLSSLAKFNTTANSVSTAATARRRSSLRPRASIAGSTYDDSDGSDMDDGASDMDITRFETTAAYDDDGRRKSVSHNRRVSWAPQAHIRLFDVTRMTGEVQSHRAAVAAQAPVGGDDSFGSGSSMSLSDDEDDAAAGAAPDEQDGDDLPDEPSIEISGAESGQLRFGGHFAGTQLSHDAFEDLRSAGEGEGDVSISSTSSSSMGGDEDGTQAMDEVTTDGITSAFNAAEYETGVFNSQAVLQQARAEEQQQSTSSAPAAASIYPSLAGLSAAPAPAPQFTLFGAAPTAPAPAATASKPRPRPSEVARQEDEEDEAVMRSLGFAKGGKPRKSRIAFQGVPEEEEDEEEDEDEDMEDATGAMEMTTAVGGLLSTSTSEPTPAVDEQPEDDDDEEGDSDAEVSMALTSVYHGPGGGAGERTMDMTFATDADGEGDETAGMDETGAMVEATTYGGILSQSFLSRPEPASAASIFASSSAARPSLVPPRAASPPKSPFRSPRRSLAPSSPAAPGRRESLRSPRRVARPSVSPAPPAASEQPAAPTSPRKSASPAKPLFAPPSSLAVPKSPRRGSVSPSPALPSPSKQKNAELLERARSRSASPAKAPAPIVATTPARGTATFNPRTLAPPASAGRSPGGSLSLRALLSGPAAAAGAPSPAKGRIEELRGLGGAEELELTGSEFEGSFAGSVDHLPLPPASLDAFFGQTGISFVNDILSLAGVDLAAGGGRRKSVAPTPGRGGADDDDDEKEPAGPPTFADMAVAGACKSLFYQLYQSDQLRLHEGIAEAQQMYQDDADKIANAADADKPRVFQDWANASEEARAVMKSQFGQIKLYYLLQGQLEWKDCRAENYKQILAVMEQNLEGLKEDRRQVAEVEIDSVIPALEARHAAVQAELLAERALDAELSSYSPEDVEFLETLHADAEEQDEQLSGNPDKGIPGGRPELDRIEQHLISYRETLDKYSIEEARLQAEIANLEERRRDKRTKADLVRLQAEFEALQRVQGWELVAFSAQAVRMRCFDEFEVVLELVPGSMCVKAVDFELKELGRKSAGQLGAQVTAFLLAKIRDEVERGLAEEGEKDARALLRYISARSTILRHIRHEIALSSLRYPTTARLITSTTQDPVLELDVNVFCARARKGFAVVVPLTAAEVVDASSVDDWARSVSATVQQRFGGNVNALALAQTVNDRLEGGVGRGALVEAVMAAEEECDHVV